MRVLITGARGFIGQHLTRALLQQPGDAQIVALDVSPPRAHAAAVSPT